jgi:hypothetical protein
LNVTYWLRRHTCSLALARSGRREAVWPHLKRLLANLTKQNIGQLTALVKTPLRRMQYGPGLLDGFLAKTGST